MKKIAIIMIITIILLSVARVTYNTVLRKIYPKKYEVYVEKYARENELDPYLVYSIIKAESNFKEKAQSKAGAVGLMQIMKATAKEIANELEYFYENEEELYKPELNIQLGCKYLASLLERYQSVEVVLAAYNAGMGNVNKWIQEGIIKEDGSDIENVPFQETNLYIRKILRDYRIYLNIYT